MSTDMNRSLQDVRDRIAQARLPPRRPRSAGDPRRGGEHRVGGLARRAVAVDRPARADVDHRPDDRQGAREPARRGAARRQRPGHAADRDPGEAERAERAGHRRRPGDRRGARRQPGPAGRPALARRLRRDRAGRGRGPGPRSSSPGSSSPSRAAVRCTWRRSPTCRRRREEETSLARINGRPAIAIDIQVRRTRTSWEPARGVLSRRRWPD